MRNSSFVGAFELYYDITEKNRALGRVHLVSTTLPTALAALFAVIASIFLVRLDHPERKTALSQSPS